MIENTSKQTYDILIVGGGIVGSALACAISQQTQLTIAVLDAKKNEVTWTSEAYDHRVSAITLASQRMFQSLGIWEAIKAKRISPFEKIEVWDAHNQGHIQFYAKEIAETYLGFIIENNVIQSVLNEKIKSISQITLYSGLQPKTLQRHETGYELKTTDDRLFRARLIVAADGAASWTRQAVDIALDKKDYDQTALVAMVETTEPHQMRAKQAFLKTGPLAFLPLAQPHLSSIVWSMSAEEADHIMGLSNDEFKLLLASSFSFRLGEISSAGQRFSFPLYKQQAKQYIKPNLALVGDAAHTLHPLAGQGVNMGLLDAGSLAEIITNATKERRDYASVYTLRRYERWRRADNFAMLAGVDILKKIFTYDQKPLPVWRSLGMNITNKTFWLKQFFTRVAVGNREGLPAIASLKS